MNKKKVPEFSERAKQYWIEKSHEVFKPHVLTEEEAREIVRKRMERVKKEMKRLYNEQMLFFLPDLERMVM